MAIYDSIDTRWSWDGDYDVDIQGDLADTKDNLLESLAIEIQTALKSEMGDWQMDPSIGANLFEFRGEANTRELGAAITDRVKSSLVTQGIVFASDLSIRVVPTHPNEVLIIVTVSATPTQANGLSIGEPVQVTFLYNTTEHDLFFLPKDLAQETRRF